LQCFFSSCCNNYSNCYTSTKFTLICSNLKSKFSSSYENQTTQQSISIFSESDSSNIKYPSFLFVCFILSHLSHCFTRATTDISLVNCPTKLVNREDAIRTNRTVQSVNRSNRHPLKPLLMTVGNGPVNSFFGLL
jgi:hypothetical protein